MSKIVFRKRPSLANAPEGTSFEIPKLNHPSRDGWNNEASQAYQEVFGVALSEAPNDLAIPFPPNSFMERFQLGLKTSFLKIMFSMLSFFSKERGTHHHGGVGAKGTIRFFQNEASNRLDFCHSTDSLPVTLRHSNSSFEDDGCSQLRAMAFRIHQSDHKFQDLILSTGAILPFWSLASLMNFANYRRKVKNDNWDAQKEWMKNSPTAFIGGIEATRVGPESYTKMSYYSCIPYGIKGTNEFVKFRVIPTDMVKESGLLTSAQQRTPWIQNRIDKNDKPERYLVNEYRERISRKPIEYLLEAQFRVLDPKEDSAEFFNLSRYWDDSKYTWQPIAKITTAGVLDDSVTESLAFWLGNIPEGLDIMESYSAVDYNSVATGRIKIYPRPQRLRKK